jgi:hypothetical protein
MEKQSFEITGGTAKQVLQKLADDHARSIKELDAILDEHHLNESKTLITESGEVLGFTISDAKPPCEDLLSFDKNLSAFVPNINHPSGVALRKKLGELKLLSQTAVTRAFGGTPYFKEGKMHFMQLRFLGKPILTFPKEMEVNLPDGLNPIQHIIVS